MRDQLGRDLSVWMPSIYGPKLTDSPEMMHLYGVGDHGGGPTRVMLDHADQLRAPDTVFPKLQFSFASEFFSDLEKKLPSMQVPTWDGELYFQYHRGVFTTQAETKQQNSARGRAGAERGEVFFAGYRSMGALIRRRGWNDTWKNLSLRPFPRHHAGIGDRGELSGCETKSGECATGSRTMP